MTRTELREACADIGFETVSTVFTNTLEVNDGDATIGSLVFIDGKVQLNFARHIDPESRRAKQLAYLCHKYNDTLVYDAVLMESWN